MARFDLTTAIALTKRLYPDGLERIMYSYSPLYAKLPKWKQFGGEGKFLVWEFARSPGASVDFATAQSNKGASQFKRPLITRSREFALASMDGEALEATLGDKNAIASIFKTAMDDAITNVTDAISVQLFRNGGGARGKLASGTVGSTTLTLANPSMARGFWPGMVLQAATTDGTSGSVESGTVTLAAVNRATGVLTATGNWSAGIATIANTDYLFRQGDFGVTIKGLDAWFPTTAPTSGDSFFGIDRSADPEWLAGVRYAPSSGNYKEILVSAVANLQQITPAAKPDYIVMNPIDWGNLMNEVGTHMVIQVPTDMPSISFDGLRLFTGLGQLTVFADAACPRYRAYILSMDTLEIWSLGDVPKVLGPSGRDGLQTLRETTADADELRVGGRLQFVCKNPSKNSVVTLPA